jgi:hypothetical protein
MPFLIIYLVVGGVIVSRVLNIMRKEWQQLVACEKERRELMAQGDYVALRLAQLHHQHAEDKMAVTQMREMEHILGRKIIVCFIAVCIIILWFPILMITLYKKTEWNKP